MSLNPIEQIASALARELRDYNRLLISAYPTHVSVTLPTSYSMQPMFHLEVGPTTGNWDDDDDGEFITKSCKQIAMQIRQQIGGPGDYLFRLQAPFN